MNSILKKITDRIREDEKTNFQSFNVMNFSSRREKEIIDIIPVIKDKFFIIAEVKKASPSKGIMRNNFDPVLIASEYEVGGASAISVITEKNFFQGKKEYLSMVKKYVNLPVLRKDFIINPFQIYESYKLGADFLLLIAACLKNSDLECFYNLTKSLGMNALVEIHNYEELDMAMKLNPEIIGINNRDLNTFEVNINTSFELKKHIPENIFVISESGIKTHDDISKLKDNGFSGALIGESLLIQENLSAALRRIIYG